MSDIEIAAIFLIVVISIIYFCYCVYNVFITRKQIDCPFYDLVCSQFIGVIGLCLFYDIYGVKAVVVIVILVGFWSCIININCNNKYS